MIYYNSNLINDWNFGDDNIIKVYRNGAIVFYKFDSEQGGYKVCYAVVDDISQYSETEFEDVYDKATEKWYKLNNLNQYEQYGVYGSGRTSCEGSSRLPVGYTEVEYVERNSTHNGYLPLGEYFTENTVIKIDFQMTQAKGNAIIGDYGSNDNDDWRVFLIYDSQVNNWLVYDFINSRNYYDTGDWSKRFHLEIGNYYIKDLNTDTYLVNATRKTSFTRPNQMYLFHMEGSQGTNNIDYGYIYSVKIYQNNELVRDFVPCIKNNDSTVGMYDLVNDVFYYPPNNGTLVAGEPITPTDCVTTYEGKLTIDDGYEYEWNGSSWVNLGEVSGSSKTSDFKIGDIDTPITSDASLITDGMYGVMLPVSLSANTSSAVALMGSSDSNTLSNLSSHTKTSVISENDIIDYAVWKFHGTATANTFYVENVATKKYFGYSDVSSSSYMPLVDESSKVPTVFSAFTKDNVTALGICKGNTPYQYYAINDLYTNHYQYNWFNPLSSAGDLNNSYVIYKVKGSDAEYPKYYSEKSEPLDNLTFNTLAEAQAYAEANCVYDGMHAIIDGDRYYFDSSDENGWVKVTEYYIVEDVTPGGASGWTITGSSTYNPQPSYYDDFSVALNSSYQTKVAKVTIYGYENFTYYLRSTGYSSYAYVTSSNVDELTSDPTSMSYSSSSAITNTYNFNKAAGSAVNLSNYRRVTYNNLDKTVEHTFYVVFYDGYYYSSYPPSATLLIPKEQTNENWEQVTFSASSNVASSQKNLYIDGNYSTSGGTQYWYYRWIVGLPSGSHTSSTNYGSYDYCPNVTTSAFTSVAGEQRQVNFTYDNTSNKTLSFRLTDGSNVLTPSDTVYFNMTYYNSCLISSSSSNVTFPRSQSVKVGGKFRFANSSNRHYIYGYSPNISLNTDYYVDNQYQDTFDITYTKLSDEAVTITYTTYDPSDVETPSFKTDITYPYSGGTTSSTTLTSFDVPYTYPYEVSQTSDKFSADSQSYTANQAARTINFVLYPNNREFATVADMEAYSYAWEGMKATVGDTKYKYENGEWVENQHSLPDVPFVLNYNAKQYNASTHSIPMTSGQLNDTDAIAYNNPSNIADHSADGYITISNSSMRIRKLGQDISLFNRSSNSTSSDLTIVCKAKSTNGENIITNRDSNYNWMYRLKTSGILTFHGTSETGSIAWNTSNPDIMSVRTYYDSGTKLKYNNWTQNTSTSPTSFTYGSTNTDSSAAGALFVGYSWSNTSEQWSGDFYWVYMAQANLTDEEIQQVIDYNENL